MKFNYRWLVVLLIIASLQLSACGAIEEASAEDDSPATVEHLDSGPDATRITLTEDAAQRIDVQTVAISDTSNGRMIPYSAVLYDTEGNTWTYINPETLTYIRTPITITKVEGDFAVLSAGPPSGAMVVTVGATELYGSESEFEEE